MALFRNVNMSFWTDPKVVDDYTPEDRYFMLWALTNNYTNIIGCYEVSTKQIARDLGYDPNSNIVENLIKRFKEIHKTIDYDFDTKELLVVNWNKYNWSSSPKLDTPLFTTIESVKSEKFHDYLASIYNKRDSVNKEEYDDEGNLKDIVLIPYRYGIDTTITNTISISNSISTTNIISNELIEEAKKYGIEITSKMTEEKLKNLILIKKVEKEFETIWSKYPNKQGKQKALKSYTSARIVDKVECETILSGLQRYLVYCKQNEDWYSPKNGSTWFNQQSWNDEYPEKKETRKSDKHSTRKEIVPDWMDKDIKTNEPTEEEKKAFEELDGVLADRVEKLKERLGTK